MAGFLQITLFLVSWIKLAQNKRVPDRILCVISLKLLLIGLVAGQHGLRLLFVLRIAAAIFLSELFIQVLLGDH